MIHQPHWPATFKQLSPRAILTGTFFVFLGPFLAVELFPTQLDRVMDKDSYVVFHNIAEFFSIMVSLSVFSVGWFTYDQSKDRRALFLSTAFLAVGLLDFMHTMSNAAMPAFLTPNSTNKSTQFWIAARLFDASAFMVSAYIYPESQSRWLSRKVLLSSALVVTGLVFTGVVYFPSYLPATAVQGVGLTPLKRGLEFAVILLLAAAAVAYWKRMKLTQDRALIYYPAAIIICIFSEGVFASYKTGFDTYNVLGHLYKIAAFYLIYQGIFVTSVKKPYVNVIDAHEKLLRETISRKELSKEVEERKRIEQALHRTIGELREAQRITHIGNWHWDAKTDATTGSDELIRIYGFDPATQSMPAFREQKGRCYPAEDWERVNTAVQRTLQTGIGYELDVRVVRDNALIWVTTRSEVVRDPEGRITGLRGTVQEITERKKAEAEVLKLSEDMSARNLELESVNKELESFIYSVSHDLRAPVRAMSGFAKILYEDYAGTLDSTGQDYLNRILKGSAKSIQLIDDLLHLSKISRHELDRIEVDLSKRASKVAEELRETDHGRNLDIVVQKGLIASVDPRLIEIVLSNLLGNAWKFTSKTEKARIEFGKLDCGIKSETANPKSEIEKTVYYVKDNGAGFDMIYSDKMFWPFHRLHTAKEFEGTGIGLTIVERVIHRHGGKVWAEGEVGKGAVFYFTL